MDRLVLGNVISLVGSIFLFFSCVAKTKRQIAVYQLLQCAVLTISQIVFDKGGGAVSMGAAGLRNLLIASGHYGFYTMIAIALTTLVLGVSLNGAGLIGLMPVGAGVFYTISLYKAKDAIAVKLALSALLWVWIVYSALIGDIFGTISNAAAQALNLVTLFKLRKERGKSNDRTST